MRLRGKAVWGIELSQAVLERDAPDLLEAGYVEQGSLTNLPYQGERAALRREGVCACVCVCVRAWKARALYLLAGLACVCGTRPSGLV